VKKYLFFGVHLGFSAKICVFSMANLPYANLDPLAVWTYRVGCL